METDLIATYIGVGIQTISATLQFYTSFRKTNVERYFDEIIKSGKDVSKIGQREDLQRYFFSIIDKVSKEANTEKIEKWKNATIHLAQDFSDFDYKDNLIRTLEDITVFELTVLYKIYSTDFQKQHFEHEIVDYYINKGASKDMVMQSIKRLSSNNLISEMVNRTAVYGGGEPVLGGLYYIKNELGKQFIAFASNDI